MTFSRDAIRYESPRPRQYAELFERPKAQDQSYYNLLSHGLLRTGGVVIARKCTYRLYSELAVDVRYKPVRSADSPGCQ